MAATGSHPDDRKLAEMVVYLSLRSEGDQYYGMTKLYKLLFYCDFLAYRLFGQSITGTLYRKLPFGPVPHKMDRFMKRLEKSGDIVIRNEDFYDLNQKRPIAMRKPRVDLFEAHELAHVDAMLERFRNSSATEISTASHQFLGWSVARQGEAIPYAVAYLDRGELTAKEQAHARKVEKRAVEWLASRQ